MVKSVQFLSLCFLLIGAVCALPAAITIDTVLVGNAGNAPDSNGRGSVDYNFRIGTYEVTNAQYTAFLNAVAATDTHGLYKNNLMNHWAHGGIDRHGSPGSYTYSVREGFADKPVHSVNYWDAARFTNWLTNGQKTGLQDASTTESGVYALNGITYPTNNFIYALRDQEAFLNGGFAIASGNEWYKAAYYDPSLNGGAGGYWLYPTQSNDVPLAELAPGSGNNSANFMAQDTFASPYGTMIAVGSYTDTTSVFGAHDMAGNVSEWVEEINAYNGQWINIRGGHYDGWPTYMPSTWDYPLGENAVYPSQGRFGTGFRIAVVPEPSTYALTLSLLAVGFAIFKRRKDRLNREV